MRDGDANRRSTEVALVGGMICAAARPQAAVAGGAPPDLRGIYVYTPLDSSQSSPAGRAAIQALGLPGADGMLLVGLWSTIEPSMGQYQWAGLDGWMSYAAASGKKIDLVIRAGDGTPGWLFQPAPAGAGATPLKFTISPHEGKTDRCQSETIAAPWDPAFLSQWDAMLSAVSQHLQGTGTYSDLTLLRLTGINRTSDELRLPAETAQSSGLSCVSDAISTWQQAGYTPAQLQSAWDKITGSFQNSFPDKSFSVAIIQNPPQLPFPPIAADGSIVPAPVPDQNQTLLQLAAQKFPGRLVVQYNFLMPGTAANETVINAAQTLGTMAAFQTNNYYSLSDGGAACGGTVDRPTPCTDSTYMALLDVGIEPLGQANPLRAQYIEVWSANANAFPGDIWQAHLLLTQTGSGVPSGISLSSPSHAQEHGRQGYRGSQWVF